MIVILSVLFCLLFAYLFYQYYFLNQHNIPQGLKETPLEKGMPFLGIYLQIRGPLSVYLTRLTKNHGPIYRIRMGMRDILVLNNFDIIKKTLKANGDVFSGRLKFKAFLDSIRHSGILHIDGYRWSKQRSFVLTVLRDFGLGREKSQEIVQNECLYFIDELIKSSGKCVDFSHLIPVYTANIICKFIMDKRYSREDPDFIFLEKVFTKITKSVDIVNIINTMFPILDESKIYCSFVRKMSSLFKERETINEIIKKVIEEHKKKFDLNVEGDDLIDRFLLKQHEMEERTGTVDTFTDWQLIRNASELFVAGFETTSTTLGWAFFFMAKFQHIQEKVFIEISNSIGCERIPTMGDKRFLNYTQAVMDEIARLATVVPLSVTHRTLTDVSVDGYFIPKDTLVFPNLYACHMDPSTWENPIEFRPERFLSSDTNGELKYTPREELIPFSIGKRQCLGESLARMEYFIFFVGILQKFKVRFVQTVSEKKYEEVLLANDGLVRFSLIKDFIFTSRE